MMPVEFVEVEISKIVVRNVLREHVIDGNQDLMGDSNHGPLITTAGFEAVKLVAQVRAFALAAELAASTSADLR
jgi:hypothetical protein